MLPHVIEINDDKVQRLICAHPYQCSLGKVPIADVLKEVVLCEYHSQSSFKEPWLPDSI